MSEEIISLENAPTIGVIEALGMGFDKLFSNLGMALRMSLPVFMFTLGTFISLMPAIYKTDSILITLACLVVGMGIFLYWFWQYLLGIIATSYLAKDIFENKTIQKPDVYFEYVKVHGASYAKYLLMACLLSIALFVILGILCFTTSLIVTTITHNIFLLIPLQVAYFIATLPLYVGLFQFSPLFWAYGDKSEPLKCIINSITACYNPKKVLPAVFGTILTHIILCAMGFLPTLIILIIFAKTIKGLDFLSTYSLVSTIIGFIGGILSYFAAFILTRFYFELAK